MCVAAQKAPDAAEEVVCCCADMAPVYGGYCQVFTLLHYMSQVGGLLYGQSKICRKAFLALRAMELVSTELRQTFHKVNHQGSQ